MTCFGISDQFSYSVREFMQKNDTLKIGTSHMGLYGSAPCVELCQSYFSDNLQESVGVFEVPDEYDASVKV